MELSDLPEEVLYYMLHLLPLNDLCVLGEASHFWYNLTGDDLLWITKCRIHWSDKQNYALTKERTEQLMGLSKKWKLIYFQSLKDAVSCQINIDIICNNVWDFKFVGETDTRIEYRVFTQDFKYPLSRVGPLTWQFAHCKDGVLGVQLEDFAVMHPERTPDWGWKLSSGQFILKSIQRDPNVDTTEKMSQINRQRFAHPPIKMVPIIFRLAGHTFIIHAALENDNPTEEQKQEIVNRVVGQLLLRGNLQRMLRRYYRNHGIDIDNNENEPVHPTRPLDDSEEEHDVRNEYGNNYDDQNEFDYIPDDHVEEVHEIGERYDPNADREGDVQGENAQRL